ncbi:hypothetical protein O9993_16290 [Vibrio lentus]|nr:hypothetical protein [Vibrio lentus]
METTPFHERVIDAQEAYQQLEAILAQKIETERIVTQEQSDWLTAPMRVFGAWCRSDSRLKNGQS